MFPAAVHRYIYLGGVFAMLFGIMLGPFPGSLPIVILSANWLLEGNFAHKWQMLRQSALPWLFTSLFFLSSIGLLHTSDFGPAFNTLRINLPLLAIPIVMFSTQPLSEKEFNISLYAFLLGCFFNTAWCAVYSFVLHSNDEARDASRFMSHIRLGLFLNMAIACCTYFFLKLKMQWQKLLMILLCLYFILMLFMLGLATGLADFMMLVFIAACAFAYRQSLIVKLAALIILVVAGALIIRSIAKIKDQQLLVSNTEYNKLSPVNRLGRPLIHYDTLGQKENGNYIYINLQLEDLRKSWNKRVPQDSFSYEPQHNLIRYNVLLRYLASRTLAKDAEGVAQLSEDDIKNIRTNIPNYLYPGWSYLHKRLYELVNEYDDYLNQRDVNGHSLTMRFYYWRAAQRVIRNNIWFGVGTGDTQSELNNIYKQYFPALHENWYKRPHNQFLSITISYGLLGLSLFTLLLIYPVVKLRSYLSSLYWPFLVLLSLSFFAEDTLETQAGMGFYILFSGLFCSAAWFKKQQTPAG